MHAKALGTPNDVRFPPRQRAYMLTSASGSIVAAYADPPTRIYTTE